MKSQFYFPGLGCYEARALATEVSVYTEQGRTSGTSFQNKSTKRLCIYFVWNSLWFMFVRITVVDIKDVVVSDVRLYEVTDILSITTTILFTVLFG